MVQSAAFTLSRAEEPIDAPITKFGGQPSWLEKPQWPLSRSQHKPMEFIGQIALADVPSLPASLLTSGKVAYVFIARYGEGIETFDPEGGENAVIIQPDGRAIVKTMAQATMPACYPDCHVHLTLRQEPEITNLETKHLGVVCSNVYSLGGDNTLRDLLNANKLGGIPCCIQHVEYPPSGGPWRLLLQMHEYNGLVEPNFGMGQAHVFVSEDGREGRLLWQC